MLLNRNSYHKFSDGCAMLIEGISIVEDALRDELEENGYDGIEAEEHFAAEELFDTIYDSITELGSLIENEEDE